jgi:CubicO group peptidase (beta-lactamase class C family)
MSMTAAASMRSGDRITIRQLLNHTSGLGDFAFGSDPDLARPETCVKFQEGCTVHDVLTPSTPTDEPAQRWVPATTVTPCWGE